MHRVPVRMTPATTDYMRGISDITGILSYEQRMLRLEYKRVSYVARTEVEDVEFALSDLYEVTLKQGVFMTLLHVQPRRMSLLDGLPGEHSEALVLRIKRKHRHAAANLVSKVSLDLSEWRLGQLD